MNYRLNKLAPASYDVILTGADHRQPGPDDFVPGLIASDG